MAKINRKISNYSNFIRKTAIRHANLMTLASKNSTFKYYSFRDGIESNFNTSYLGKIGEVLFMNYLESINTTIIESPLLIDGYNKEYRGLNGDVKITLKNKPTYIEIKTINIDKDLLQIDLSQSNVSVNKVRKSNYHVFILINDYTGQYEFLGCVKSDDIINISKKVCAPNSFFGIKDFVFCKASNLVFSINNLLPISEFYG